MGKFIGEVKPIYGRWHWPLKEMEEGDYFIVDQARRSAEDVRHYITVRAAQLGMLLSTTKQDEEYPGYTRVTRRAPDDEATPEAMKVEFSVAKAKLEEWYGANINEVCAGAGMCYLSGKPRKVLVEQIKKPPLQRMLFDAHEENFNLGLVFNSEGFTMYPVPRRMPIEQWKPEPLMSEVMS